MKKLFAFSVCFVLAACANTSSSNCSISSGKMSFSKVRSGNGFCHVDATFSNQSSEVLAPTVHWTAFDANQNTLDQGRLGFNVIRPGKQQTKTMSISVPANSGCDKVKELNASAFSDTRLGIGSVCGAYNRSFEWK